MAVVQQQQQSVHVFNDEDWAALVSGMTVQIRETTANVINLRDSIYTKANFWIGTSRQYVGGHRLYRYLHQARVNMYWPLPFCLFISLIFSPALGYIAVHLAGAIFNTIMFAVGVAYLLLFTQHTFVNSMTIPHVLKQPSVPDHCLKNQNEYYEVTVEQFQAVFAASSNAGIGVVLSGTGKVKIQVFQKSAFLTMKICCVMSTIGLILSVILTIFSLVWAIKGFELVLE